MKKYFSIALLFLLILFVNTAFAVEVTLLGPKQYLRTTGQPNIYTDTFPGRIGNSLLLITNGKADGTDRVSSAIIKLNGLKIMETRDFNQNFYERNCPTNIGENNLISVELRSAPGSYLTIKIIQDIQAKGAGVVGVSGGTVEVTDVTSNLYGVKLEVPSSALNESKVISIDNPSFFPPYPQGYSAGGNPIELRPSGLIFNQPANLIIPSNGQSEINYYAYDIDEQGWDILGTILNNNKYEIRINQFSTVNWLCRYVNGLNECRAFQPYSTVTYKIDATSNNVPGFSEEQIKDAIRRAINKWGDVLNGSLIFREVETGESDVRFSWSNEFFQFVWIDSMLDSETLANTCINLLGNKLIRFNDTGLITWTADNNVYSGKASIETIALHEFGHALGLIHKCNACEGCVNGAPVMAPFIATLLEPQCNVLQVDDINRIRELYGICVPNPSFENGTGQWPDGWEPYGFGTFSWDNTMAHTGTRSVSISNVALSQTGGWVTTSFFPVDLAKKCEISAWFFQSGTPVGYAFTYVGFLQYDTNGKELGWCAWGVNSIVGSWAHFQMGNYGWMLRPQTSKVKIMLYCRYWAGNGQNAIVWFDDVNIIQK